MKLLLLQLKHSLGKFFFPRKWEGRRLLILETSSDASVNMDLMLARLNAPDHSEVLRKAMATLDMCMSTEEEGGKIILEDPQGKQEDIRIIK